MDQLIHVQTKRSLKSLTNHISADSHQNENQPQVSQNAEHGGDGEYPQS